MTAPDRAPAGTVPLPSASAGADAAHNAAWRVGAEWPAPWWLPGGNAQTIWPALFGRTRHPSSAAAGVGAPWPWRRERWTTPDADFIDVDWIDPPQADARPPARAAPTLVLFHGLEGSSASHYARAFADWALRHGWRLALPHFRGCSGAINLAPRAYHSADFEEIGWILERARELQGGAPLWAAGVSLGGNALLRWAQEAGDSAARTARAVCAISAPVDLAAAGHAIRRGFNRQVYDRMFLATMKPKALAKLAQHPGLFSRERLLAARDLYEFDEVFTAPLHGFRGVDDYWSRGSSRPHLERIRLPALVINARNDPFVPAASLPTARDAGRCVTLWQPRHGGHVGFPRGRFPADVTGLPEAVMAWMAEHAPV